MPGLNLWILLSFFLCVSSWNQSYVVENVSIQNYPGKLVATNFKMIGRYRAINGSVELFEDISVDRMCSVEVYSNVGFTGYKKMPIEVPVMNFCDVVRTYFSRFVKDTLKEGVNTDIKFGNGDVCPLPKGQYWVKNVQFDTRGWPVVMPRGLVKAMLHILDDDREIDATFEIIVNIKDNIF